MQDVNSALRLAAKACQLGAHGDPGAVGVLAKALAVHGEAEKGLACLERLYNTALPSEAAQEMALRIRRFRKNYGLGLVYQVRAADGGTLTEYGDADALSEALRARKVPETAQCRLDRVGPWQPLRGVLAREAPRAMRAAAKRREAGVLGPLLAGIAAAIAAALAVLHWL